MLVLCILILIAVLWIQYRWKNRHIYEMARRLNPGLTTLPILGHSYKFIGSNETRMKGFQDLGRNAFKHESGLIAMWLGYTLYTVVADPVAAELIMKSNLEKDSILHGTRLYIGNGSVFAPVNIWRTRRKVIMQCVTPKVIKQFLPLITKNSEVLLQKCSEIAGTGTISIWKYLSAFSFDINTETGLGCKLHAQNNSEHPFLSGLDFILQIIARRVCSPWLRSDLIFRNLPSSKKSFQMLEYIRQFLSKVITSKRKEILERNCKGDVHSLSQNITFLELLIQYSKDGKSCTDTEIMEELLVLLTAAIDTSAVASSFTCLMLLRYPEVQQKVFEELQDIFGNSDRTPTLDDLDHLKYLEMTIKETLRLYPSVPIIARHIDKELSLPSGITICPGTNALINIWAIHRNPRYWGEDAEQFRPERFIEAPLKHPVAFMPFSFGPRNCIGYQYAMMSMKIAISTILRNFKILPPNDLPCTEQPPIRLQFDVMMKDVDKFLVRLEHRVK